MRGKLILSVALCLLVLFSSLVWGHDDKFGKPDTCRVTVVQKEKSNKVEAKVFLANDEDLAGLTVPLKFGGSKKSSLLCDSISYANTRVDYFSFKSGLIDTTGSALLIGLIADLSGKNPPLKPGSGQIATIYFTIKKGAKPAVVILDTCFVNPSNVLKLITPDVKEIVPVFDNKNAKIKIK